MDFSLDFSKSKTTFEKKLPKVIFAVLLLLTFTVWVYFVHLDQIRNQRIFSQKTSEIKNRIRMRLQEHEKLLRSGTGLFNSVGNVTRVQWRQFVAAIELDQNHPGIQGVGFTLWFQPSEKESLIQKIRKEGFPDFVVKPAGDRKNYTSIIYLEPFNWRNQRAFGYDMYSEPLRRRAMDRAVDEAIATVTNKIILLQETEKEMQAGILMYIPVYRVGALLDTPEERRKALRGFVYSPIRMKDFIQATLARSYDDISIEINDDDAQQTSKNLYRTMDLENPNSALPTHQPAFSKLEKVDVFNNQIWEFKFNSRPSFESMNRSHDADYVLALGLLLTFLLTYISYAALSARQKAFQLVEATTRELRASEQKLQAVLNFSQIAIAWANDKTEIEYINPRFTALFGYSKKDVPTVQDWYLRAYPDPHYREIVVTEWNSKVTKSMHERSAIGSMEVSITCADGQKREVQLVGSWFDTNLLINFTDISELKKREKALKESEERFSHIFLKSPDAYFIMDTLVGRIIDCNLAAGTMLRGTREKIIGLTPDQISPSLQPSGQDSLVAVKDHIRDTLKNGIHRFEWMHRRFDGEEFWAEVSISLMSSHQGQVLLVAWRDISERKKMEENLRFLASVFLNSYDGVLIADINNQILDVSPSFSRITGYQRNEVVGKTPKILSSGQHDPEFYQKMWNSLKTQDFWSGEIWNRRKNGEIFPETLSISAVKDKNNSVTHYVAIFSDISAIKNQESKLIEARRQAETATLAKSQFLATMSHEIRTPLNGILGMAQLLSLDKVDEFERLDFAKTILSSGQILLTLLNDILDLSKVEAGKIQLENLTFSPVQLMQETQMLYAEIAKRKSLHLEFQWHGPQGQYYMGDPYRLRQMLSNLVSNALKFTEVGQVRIEIRELSRNQEQARLEFSVIDTGIGIPPDKLKLLFNPFTQLDSTTERKYGGSGLGLSIVANLARLMQGEFGAHSELHKGSKFWFTIGARWISSLEQSLLVRPTSLLDSKTAVLPKQFLGKVMVVDDDLVNLKVIEKFLQNLGVSTILLGSGDLALQHIKKGEAIDLILMDLQMPVMDGITTVQLIRAWEKETQSPYHRIVAFTADAFDETHQRCLNLGMDDILTKPVSIEKLKIILGRASQHRAS